ncbi:uncharacterized protein LOC108905927 isoform X2 [Anoplophora glabripennis]|uniref:uncharacterized protein LOC108905927 isoform X2 n=1 Tax=Anoplophora glabripennis TaxID=217634 RepID=UPI00087529C6|nr:uncharacterized protein LOC108905927 isoform X2 [Anoplophora glabripennis]
MDTMLFTFIILLYFSFVSSDKYNILPPIYEMEDYLECFERNDSYCKVDARLTNNGYENNSLWKSINDSIKDRNSYDRTIIHRAICLPKREVNLNSTKKFSELHINEKFIGNNLTASVENVFCITKDIINISLYDKLILFSFVAYLLLILYATMYDTWKRTSTVESTKDKVITALSLTSNWRKVCNTEGNEDHIKLKSIQGIRFYNMLLVISLHTHLSFYIVYISNPQDIEINQKVISILWFLIFFGLPSAVIFFARHEFRGIRAAILGALVKPLFSLGIGIGILGMSHNMGGIIKHICENKYAVLMSNFSFCTYVFQIYVIFSKGIKSYSLMQFTLINTIKYNLFFDAPLAIIVGIISKLVFEQPGINLQKLFLPQIASKKEQLKRE